MAPKEKEDTQKKAVPKTEEMSIEILKLKREVLRVRIVGTSPMIYNRVGQKAREEFVLPMTAEQKKAIKDLGVLKHDPPAEYRGSVYRYRDDDHPTRLLFPAGGAKKSLLNAITDMPGKFKAPVGRNCRVIETDICIWGIPELFMTIVTTKGQNRTPDIRTRAILPEWCAEFTLRYSVPLLTLEGIANLVAAAGDTIGWGDYRSEKGAGNYGSFEMVEDDDEAFARIQKTGGRVAQDAALANPAYYDIDTEELMEWFLAECKRRKIKLVS